MEDLNLKQSTGRTVGSMGATSKHLHLAGATYEELKEKAYKVIVDVYVVEVYMVPVEEHMDVVK
ncbi:hypothetical protein HAX54_017357, partial [Datura stramonium]|nr:hypothetical protein [Datura stramonium]